MISFAIENGMHDIERDGFKFLQSVKEIVSRGQGLRNVEQPIVVVNHIRSGAPKMSRVPSRKFPPRKKTGPKTK